MTKITIKQTTVAPSTLPESPTTAANAQKSKSFSQQKESISAHNSLGEILAALPKEKLEKFKQYLLTLDKKEKRLVSKALQNNLEAARKFSTTTESIPEVQNEEHVIDLGILGSFRLEKSKQTIFEDEITDNQIKTERPSPVFKTQ